MRTLTKELQSSLTPMTALDLLKKGNERFINNLRSNRNLLQQVNDTSEGQFPFATILSCIDSRTSAELIFDQGLGDIFSIRIAGNILNEDILGSMEFACKVAGSKVIIVLGHTKCGAIKGACDHVKMGNLTALLSKIRPIVEDNNYSGLRIAQNLAFVDAVAADNVQAVVREIQERSTILNEMIENGEIGIVGAMYNVESGSVTWIEQTASENLVETEAMATVA